MAFIDGIGAERRRAAHSAERAEIERLRKKNARLEGQLDKHRKALEI